MKYQYSINHIVAHDYKDLKSMISEVFLTISKIEEEYTASIEFSVPFPDTDSIDINQFKPYEELTENDIISWIQPFIETNPNNKGVEQWINDQLSLNIHTQKYAKHRSPEFTPLPWSTN